MPPHEAGGGGTEGASLLLDDPPQPRSSGLLLALCLLGGAACLVIAGLLLMLALPGTDRDRPDSAAEGPGGQRIVHVTPQSSQTSNWSNVAQGIVINLNSVEVDVDYVGYGEVRAKDAANRVIVSEDKNYLQVFVNIKNLRSAALRYNSWYGNSFDSSGRQVAATLVDDQGQQYEMLKFTHVTAIMGHTPNSVLDAKGAVKDVIVFVMPSTVNRGTIRYFHLDLPAAAYDGSGSYRFEIPSGVIQGF